MRSVVWFGVVVVVCVGCVSDPTQPGEGPPEVPVFDGPDEGALDPDDGEPVQEVEELPATAHFFEIGFIDRDGPAVSDPADPDIPIAPNFVNLLRTDDGSVRQATDSGMASQSVRFVPLTDPANPGPGEGNAVVYDASPVLGGARDATGAFTLTDLDVALDNSPTPLLSLATPDNVDIDPTGQRVIACGVNFSPCICCGVRTKARLLSLTGGADQPLEDALNDALAMQLMTGATECQFAMDGTVVYAAGKDMSGNPALVRAMIGDGAVMAEPVPEAGSQGVQSFDVSPDGMKIVFVNPLTDGGGVTVRDLSGAMMPFTLSEPAVDIGEDWAARRRHQSPRWCDDTHVVWQTIDGTRRTVYLADTMSRERVDLWSDENRIPLSESWLDCRVREE
jgi:hypothetical protein